MLWSCNLTNIWQVVLVVFLFKGNFFQKQNIWCVFKLLAVAVAMIVFNIPYAIFYSYTAEYLVCKTHRSYEAIWTSRLVLMYLWLQQWNILIPLFKLHSSAFLTGSTFTIRPSEMDLSFYSLYTTLLMFEKTLFQWDYLNWICVCLEVENNKHMLQLYFC